ncbi:peptide/nickel transport system ATP-binding protein [Pseudooceanicola antarcticus]|uniref:ABC transporter ATP-binding protein n=1 Tax=Pseudooceanicola antarcticus TaxID=1247613 RepID=A0A285J8A3_9RHOB|nr:ATP-binding cassette domain-containing protein [Pseudooceanicola antarcticus]PJE27090.1 ABC transporter ATP-binding protein [Pseudooceanicola antarcticus]SNY56452.1 peptide/nickel transport system ATP-binding protein [Pseudooceanicola antarcticus]
MSPVLDCRNLSVSYGPTPVVHGLSFTIAPGQCLALVGSSGSGKTSVARAILGMQGPTARIGGQILVEGRDMSRATERDWRALRGLRIGYVAQDPFAACDPLRSVGHHLSEAWRARGLSPDPAEISRRLTAIGIEDAPRIALRAPHCWSGGMLQRASIAAASAHAPPLIIADEPSSALDADRADGILTALRASGAAILLISHDLALVQRQADRIVILDQGHCVESLDTRELGGQAHHPVTQALLAASQSLPEGTPTPRHAEPRHAEPLIRVQDIARRFHGDGPEVGQVSFSVIPSQTTGISGPSGSGKSTVLKMLAGLERPDRGLIERAPSLARPGAIMPIFQNPAASLDALWPVWRSVAEPAQAQHRMNRNQQKDLAAELLARVGLAAIDPEARPSELSLGQCQRVAIARAIAARPAVLIADEPTSALDTLSRARIGDLLAGLVAEGMALVVASHDPWLHARLNARRVEVARAAECTA